jgi:O-antigen/teichoic acid export membrane protein
LLVLARALRPAEFGILAIAALTYNALTALNHMGVADALTYVRDRVETAARTALSMMVVGGLFLTGATWLLAPLIAHFFHSPGATFVLRGFAICIPFDAAAQVPIGRLTRSLSFSRRTVTDALPQAIGAVVTVGVVLAGYPLIGVVAGQIACSVTNVVTANLIGPRCLPGWDTGLARELLRYGKYLSGADILNLGLLNVDYLVVGHVLGPAALGMYSLAYRICFMPYLAVAVVANGALFPYYCRLPTRAAKASSAENALSLITTLSVPWFAGLVLFASDITLLGTKWTPAVGAIRFLAVYALFLSLILSALEVLKAVGRTDLVFVARGVHLLILTVVLIATVRHGFTIVALDQALVACVIFLLTAVWLVRRAGLRAGALTRSVALPVLAALGMAPVVILLTQVPALSLPSWQSLLVAGPLALAVFAVLVRLFMPTPVRKGWAAVRGRRGSGPGDLSAAAASGPGQ